MTKQEARKESSSHKTGFCSTPVLFLFFLSLHGLYRLPRPHNAEPVTAMIIPKNQSEWKATLWNFFHFPCKSSHNLLINKWGYSQGNWTKSLPYYLDLSQIIHHGHKWIWASFSHISSGGLAGLRGKDKVYYTQIPRVFLPIYCFKNMQNILLSINLLGALHQRCWKFFR